MIQKLLLIPLLVLATVTAPKAQNEKLMNKQTNSDAPVKCSKSIVINSSPQKVWMVLSNINNWASWQTEISHPKLNGPLQPNATFIWKTSGATIHSTLQTVVPNKLLGWTGKTWGATAIHNWIITDLNGQAKVSVEETMDGFLTKLFKKKFNKILEKGMLQWLELLKKECEK